MPPDQAIDPYYVVRRSSIHNRGIFAARDIPAGAHIIEYLGEKVTKAESNRRGNALFDEASKTGDAAVYLFILNKKHDLDGNFDWNTARLINHSCEPNCEAVVSRGRIWIVALRFIPEGEELSFNYGFDLECWQDHPCRCGKPSCVGYIIAEEYWPKLKELIAERDAAIAEWTAPPDDSPKKKKKAPASSKKKLPGKKLPKP
jgi:SET domain-containing protein